MAEKVVVEYDIELKNIGAVQGEIKKTTALTEELSAEAKGAFSGKQIDEATKKLETHNKALKATNEGYKTATAELKALTNQIASGKLDGKELQTATKRAAELKDTIGDVRQEIDRLSSDTRTFDLIAEGARGVAGAFAVAQSAAALFGDENEDLQKGILKAQAGLTFLTGVQELATIATNKGGIAARALAAAEEFLAATSEAAGISIATATALATGGLALVAGAIAFLVINTDDATDSNNDFTTSLEEEEAALTNINNALSRNLKLQNSAETDKIIQAENTLANTRDRLVENDKEQLKLERQILDIRNNPDGLDHAKELEELGKRVFNLNEKSRDLTIDIKVQENQLSQARTEQAKKFSEDLAKQNELLEGQRRLRDKEDLAAIEVEAKRRADIEEKVLSESLDLRDKDTKERLDKQKKDIESGITKVPAINIPITVNNEDPAFAFAKFTQDFAKTLNDMKPFVDAFVQLTTSIFANQTQQIKNEKEQQLSILDEGYQLELQKAGDNDKLKIAIKANYEKKRQQIEKESAIKSAKIARDQAILERSLALFNIVLNTANAISKLTAGLPFTLPQIILTGVLAAAQTAAVLAAPLPAVPKFAEGVINLNGKGTGTSDDIPAFLSKGESVITAKATDRYTDELQAAQDMRLEQFIMEKYLAPALRAAKIELQNEAYDDANLRHTIRKSNKENAKEIASAIRESTSWNNYANQRYYN